MGLKLGLTKSEKEEVGDGESNGLRILWVTNAQVTFKGKYIRKDHIIQSSWWIPHYSFFVFSSFHYSPLYIDNTLMFKIVTGIRQFLSLP